jgi:hypothetical protein
LLQDSKGTLLNHSLYLIFINSTITLFATNYHSSSPKEGTIQKAKMPIGLDLKNQSHQAYKLTKKNNLKLNTIFL